MDIPIGLAIMIATVDISCGREVGGVIASDGFPPRTAFIHVYVSYKVKERM